MGDPHEDLNEALHRSLQNVISGIDPGPAEEEFDDFEFTDENKSRLSFVETLRALVAEFDGPSGVAKHVKKLFRTDCPANTKARILENIISGIQSYGEDSGVDDQESIDAVETTLRSIHYEEFLEQIPKKLRDEVRKHIT